MPIDTPPPLQLSPWIPKETAQTKTAVVTILMPWLLAFRKKNTHSQLVQLQTKWGTEFCTVSFPSPTVSISRIINPTNPHYIYVLKVPS